MTERRVVVVTGGGGGIGAAVAEELGRRGDLVVTLDPLVTLDGSEALAAPEETTADRIVAAGGMARASSASVTDAQAVSDLFAALVAEHGRLDAVVNVAGITRPTGFATGSEDDWRSVVAVHLDGYRTVLEAALPIMAAAGRGSVVGITSGSGWRPADAGAYSCAKRAVAALTWQLGRAAPPGIAVNALSPIAVTRMVTAALARSGGSGRATGGLSLGTMPEPAELGPLGAHFASEGSRWCRGQVVFVAGSEAALVEPPRLLEVVRADGVDLHAVLDAVTPAWAAAEQSQASGGGSNPRFTAAFAGAAHEDAGAPAPAAAVTCALVASDDEQGRAVAAALAARGIEVRRVDAGSSSPPSFAEAAALLRAAGAVDAVVVVPPAAAQAVAAPSDWERVLAEHRDLAAQLLGDAAWRRAVADRAAAEERPCRLVAVLDATSAGGRSRAQSAAQASRVSRAATADRVEAFVVGVEAAIGRAAAAELAAHLVTSASAGPLAGAELVAGDGWLGLRSHPRPVGAVALGAGTVPPWFDAVLQEVVDP